MNQVDLCPEVLQDSPSGLALVGKGGNDNLPPQSVFHFQVERSVSILPEKTLGPNPQLYL